jgi:cytochrome c biogenesis protein CcdA
MKKLFTNSNPFILLLAPLAFAIIMGVSYQFEQKRECTTEGSSTVKATSLFVKGITLVKTVCSISKEKVW